MSTDSHCRKTFDFSIKAWYKYNVVYGLEENGQCPFFVFRENHGGVEYGLTIVNNFTGIPRKVVKYYIIFNPPLINVASLLLYKVKLTKPQTLTLDKPLT